MSDEGPALVSIRVAWDPAALRGSLPVCRCPQHCLGQGWATLQIQHHRRQSCGQAGTHRRAHSCAVAALRPTTDDPHRRGVGQQGMHRAMRGNVTTYEMNTTKILDMVEGQFLPQKPSLLAALIAVTFVGVGSLRDEGA